MAKNKELFIVTTGSYSDYRLFGVYDTQEKAEAIKKAIGYDANDVFSVTLNEGYAELKRGLSGYRVEMAKNGESEVDEVKFEDGLNSNIARLMRGYDWEARKHTDEISLEWRGMAKDKKHAVKIVNEIRTQLIANNEWDTQGKNYRDIGKNY